MEDEITVETSPDGAGTDEITPGQPLIQEEQPAMATQTPEPTPPAAQTAEPAPPASNMADIQEPQYISPSVKGKAKVSKKNTNYSPMTTGINYQIFNPLGLWPPVGQQPSLQPSPMAAGPSWAMPPLATPSSHYGTTPLSFAPAPTAPPPFFGLVKILLKPVSPLPDVQGLAPLGVVVRMLSLGGRGGRRLAYEKPSQNYLLIWSPGLFPYWGGAWLLII